MKWVIINADDFGLSEGINLGIIKAHREGVVTSTSAAVNGDFFEQGLNLLKQTPKLDVGIHLNLTAGKPISSPHECKTLLDKNGRFFNYSSFVQRLLLKRINPEEIKRELRAQLERFLSHIPVCSHINSHKHIGYIPAVLDTVLELAQEFKIKRMRLPMETKMLSLNPFQRRFLKRYVLKTYWFSFLAKRAKPKLKKYKVVWPEHFFGIPHMGYRGEENIFVSLLKSCQEGFNEIMCHPSLVKQEREEGYGAYGPLSRYRELKMLIDPALKALISKMNLKTISFLEMKKEE